jgi:hypothetical protein
VAAKYWTCRKCGGRWERRIVKCRGESCAGRRPKRPVRAHQKVLRDNSYAAYVQVAADIHGVTDESCCACGKPRSQERHHDRDHDHRLSRMRGLLCPGDTGCNKLLLPWISARVAAAIWDAKQFAGEPDAARWGGLAAYLERVEAHYSDVAKPEVPN